MIIPNWIIIFLKSIKLYDFSKKIFHSFIPFLGLIKSDIESLLFLQSFKIFKKIFLIDAGCYQGKIIDLALNINKDIKILAFEPFLNYFINLKKKYKLFKNIKVYNYAITNNNNKKIFYYNNKKIDKESFSLIKNNKLNKKTFVNCRKLDNYIIFKPNIIKIDIEGAEVKALNGCSKILNKQETIFFIEVTNKTISKISKILEKNNYYFYIYEYNFFKKKIPNIWNKNNVIKNNFYKKKIYNYKSLKKFKFKYFMFNIVCIPKKYLTFFQEFI